MMAIDPALALLLIIAIGVAVGLAMYRYAGSSWLNQLTGTRRGYLTSALVGVAGSFIGYHLAVIVGSRGIVALLIAALGAAAVIWAWRTIKL